MDPASVMAIETEKKYRVTAEEFEDLPRRIASAGGSFVRHDTEVNIIYPLEALSGRQGVVRIRRVGDTTLLTLKRRMPGASNVKRQVEYETAVADAGALSKILSALGLTAKLIYEKRRSVWTLGNAEVVLDVLPFGKFVEIEATESEIGRIEDLIGLGDNPGEPATYPQLTALHGREVDDRIEARFSET